MYNMSYRFSEDTIYRKRRCYQCNKEIGFAEFLLRNRTLSKKRLSKLWESDIIELFCCLCYDSLKREQYLNDLRNQLSDVEKDVLNIIEARIKSKLNILPIIKCNSVGFEIQNNTVIGLSLYMCNLSEIPSEIQYLPCLKMLNLSWNHLEEIPPFLSRLQTLNTLDFIGNNISKISPNIDRLENLEEFDISFNNLKTIPSTLANLRSIKRLNLIHNSIIEIPKTFQKLYEKDVKVLL